MLIVLSFRIGKSVFLEFAENIDVKLIFTGLASMMAIGPLFYLFTQSCANKTLPHSRLQNLAHFIPSLLGLCFGLWLTDSDLETIPIWVFAVLFLSYYLHYLIYLIVSRRYAVKHKLTINPDTFKLLTLLFFALLAIWIVYVLNLFDETVPYIVGPVLYSVVAYTVSFEVIRKGYIGKIGQEKYKTTSANNELIEQTFNKAKNKIVDEEGYKNPEITLKSLSESLSVSTQILSMSINQKSGKNFNNYVNNYRIMEASRLFKDKEYDNLTIAAIAFEVGFNSISSFNTAFKKQTGQTPQEFRKMFSK